MHKEKLSSYSFVGEVYANATNVATINLVTSNFGENILFGASLIFAAFRILDFPRASVPIRIETCILRMLVVGYDFLNYKFIILANSGT